MPILTQCPHCKKKFRAPDKVAGKAVKCPGCQGAVRVAQPDSPKAGASESAGDSWFILTENREQMGPVTKEQLDNLATKGRLGFCQIRRSDWRAWKWADDVYPDLPPSERKRKPSDSASKSDEQDAARLVMCPDCGNTVSRRATGCPHCGCPAAVLLKQMDSTPDGPVATRPPPPASATSAAGEAAPDVSNVVEPKRSGSRRLYAIAGGVTLALVIGGGVWWAVQAAKQKVVEQVAEIVQPEQPSPPPELEEPSEEMLSPDDKKECIDQAARKMAEHIDEIQRKNHLPLAMISQTADSVKMLEALASGDLNAIPESTSAVPGGTGVKPYKSQVRELFIECRDWVRDHVDRGACTATHVWETAGQWDKEKQEAVLKPLGGLSVEGLTPEPTPEGP